MEFVIYGALLGGICAALALALHFHGGRRIAQEEAATWARRFTALQSAYAALEQERMTGQ